jgi:beta-phosphoglucomutase-like phosphatase (HAD superfamily)/dTDP-glucose pyrophosphorylase
MTVKLLIFDLDGVLINTCDIHYQSLNQALLEICGFTINLEDHINIFNGLNTKTKLEILTNTHNIDRNLHTLINNRKQELTKTLLENIKPDKQKQELLLHFKKHNYKLHCASNCISETLYMILEKMGIKQYFDHVFSNEDVKFPKPSPEIYYNCFIKENLSSSECIIFEDSILGIQAAVKSGANVCHIPNSNYLQIDKVNEAIEYYNNKLQINIKTCFMNNINVVIPMAGNGSRFKIQGYTKPKPLIDVNDIPMITSVVRNIGFDANYIFIVKEDHCIQYNLDSILKSIVSNCNIIPISETTQGAACTVLLAKHFINNDQPLFISNCDQFLEWNSIDFINNFLIKNTHLDAVISTFKSDGNPKWSYAKIDSHGFVNEVAEKRHISDLATTGIYLWRKGQDFVKYAEQMISKNIRVNNEFYVAPVFNEAILNNKKIGVSNCDKMWGLGVPEDLEYFLSNI